MFLHSPDNGNIEEVLTADMFFLLGQLSDISHIHVFSMWWSYTEKYSILGALHCKLCGYLASPLCFWRFCFLLKQSCLCTLERGQHEKKCARDSSMYKQNYNAYLLGAYETTYVLRICQALLNIHLADYFLAACFSMCIPNIHKVAQLQKHKGWS